MVSIQEIEQKLNIIVGDRDINEGMCKPMKNRYYNFNNEFFVVELKQDKYGIFSNDQKTRDLLSNYTWYLTNGGYVYNRRIGGFHKNYIEYDDNLVADHINRIRCDNRLTNLRIATPQQNSRNRTIDPRNTSGKNGVSFYIRKQSWYATIWNNNYQQIKKSFSINRYGNAEAKQMAIDQRKLWEREFNYNGE